MVSDGGMMLLVKSSFHLFLGNTEVITIAKIWYQWEWEGKPRHKKGCRMDRMDLVFSATGLKGQLYVTGLAGKPAWATL